MGRLGEFIRSYRQHRGLTLGQVARKTGLSVPFLSDLELGRRPGTTRLAEISAAIGCDPDEMMLAAGVVPPDIAKWITGDRAIVEMLRRMMNAPASSGAGR